MRDTIVTFVIVAAALLALGGIGLAFCRLDRPRVAHLPRTLPVRRIGPIVRIRRVLWPLAVVWNAVLGHDTWSQRDVNAAHLEWAMKRREERP